jgi:hypothetical protein
MSCLRFPSPQGPFRTSPTALPAALRYHGPIYACKAEARHQVEASSGSIAGSAEVRAFCVPLWLFLAIPLYPSPFIGGQQHAIHRQPARRGDGALGAARVIVHARPRPLLRPAYQPCLHGIPMDILYLGVVLLHGAQSPIQEAGLLQRPPFAPGTVNPLGRAILDGFHHTRSRQRMARIENGMPVVREEHPGGKKKPVLGPPFRDHLRQGGEF